VDNLDDIIKAAVVLIIGIAIMSSLSTLPGGQSFANLGLFLIFISLVVGLISIIMPYIKGN